MLPAAVNRLVRFYLKISKICVIIVFFDKWKQVAQFSVIVIRTCLFLASYFKS